MPAFAFLPITCDRIKSISGPGVKISGITVKANNANTDISFPFINRLKVEIVSAKSFKIGFQIFYN